VAWLHDVVEDTDMTLEDIRLAGFGIVICNALRLLTHDKSVPYMDYVRKIAENPIARAVKIADLQDNMNISRLPEVDDAARRRLAKYLEAYSYLTSEDHGEDAE